MKLSERFVKEICKIIMIFTMSSGERQKMCQGIFRFSGLQFARVGGGTNLCRRKVAHSLGISENQTNRL